MPDGVQRTAIKLPPLMSFASFTSNKTGVNNLFLRHNMRLIYEEICKNII